MSGSFGLFESDEASQAEPRLAARTAARKLEAAVDVVRAQFGRFLLGATGIDEFGDRWHYSKADIRQAVEPYVFPNTGTMRRIQNAMKQDWKLAHPYKLAEDRDAPIQNLDETYHPSDADLIPEGNFEGYKDSVDQNGPSKVESNDFVPGKEAARLVADIYTDFAQANGLRVASLDTLDLYANNTGIHEADYRLLESMIVRAAECEDDDSDEDDESDDDDEDDDSEGGEAPDFGGESDHEEPDSDDEDNEDDDSEGGEAPDFGGGDQGGEEQGGGEQYTIPEQAPELDPQMLNEIPHDDPQGAAPVPPEVIDSLLGLPAGTIEQLLLEEVQQGQGGGDGFGGPPAPGPEQGDPAQGGGDDFFGPGGGDPEGGEPPRTASRRLAWNDYSDGDLIDLHRKNKNPGLRNDVADELWNRADSDTETYGYSDLAGHLEHRGIGRPKKPVDRMAARRFWAADDQESESDSGGGDSSGGGGGEQAAPPQDPSGGMGGGMDPSMMGQQPMMPPPGSAQVAPPQPPMPLENQPAEDALLDTANQAIMQMIDRETQEYQQIIAPLTQALQAVQFAQQVEQTENPMDVTPPDGTVNVNPSMAPGGAQNPQQQLARLVRKAKKDVVIKNAARLIARTYGVSESMLREAMGRRQYEHAAEAFQILPEAARQDPHVVAAASHIAEMFHANDGMFNKPVFLQQALGGGMARAAGTAKDRLQNGTYTQRRDKRRDEHGQQDLADAQAEDEQNHWEDDPDYQKLYNRNAFRSRLPFDRARSAGYRQAGETWKNTSTMDAFEHPKAGQVPEITDNLTINDLPQPQYKGLPKPKKNTAGLGEKVQKWFQRQVDTGLNMGGDAMAERYITEHKAPASQRGIDEVHQVLNVNPHPATDSAVKTPKTVAPKAVNPVTKKGTWGEWEPTKEASFFTRKVPGWRWDDHLSGYLSKEAKAFTCSCGQKVAAPSYKTCGCGKVWNIYAIGDTHHLASDTAEVFIAREIPVRPGVIMANKKLAGYEASRCPGCGASADNEPEDTHHDQDCPVNPGGRLPALYNLDSGDDDYKHYNAIGRWPQFQKAQEEMLRLRDTDHDRWEELAGWRPRRRNSSISDRRVAKGDCNCWDGYERVPGTKPCAEGSCRKCDDHRRKESARRATASQRELEAMIDKLADWTKYDDDVDPAVEVYGKSKVPSTKVSQPPKDWAKRKPAGDPDKRGGTWTPPSIPRKKK